MAKVFFCCSMRGGFSEISQEDLKKASLVIEELGHKLITKHNTSPTFEEDEKDQSDADIHDQDYRWLMECDFVVAEISNPSLGVGGEISDACNIGKPVLLVYRSEVKNKVSAYTRGKAESKLCSNVEAKAYGNLIELKKIVKDFTTNTKIKKNIIKSAAIILKDKKVLGLKKNNSPLIISPGGKVEGKETYEEALKRELKEELNIKVNNAKYFTTLFSKKAGHNPDKTVTLHMFLVGYDGNPEIKNEITGMEWLNYADQPREEMTDGMRQLLEILKEKEMIE